MPIKRTISGRIGKGSIGHDNRLFIAENVDASRTERNIVLVREDIEQVYHELFDKPLEEYNSRQKRKDRRIKNYYEHIRRSKQEKPFYEVIFQIGNNEDTRCGTAEAKITTKALTEFVQSFQKRNPQLRVFNAVIHLDEETPHVHLDFIPFATGQKRGLSTRNTLTGALEQQGYKGEGKLNTCSKLWIDSEKQALADIMGGYGIEWQQLDTHEQHLDVLDYKKKMRTREVAVLENKVQTTNSIIESRQRVLESADEVIDRLDREYAEKTDMVEQLDNTIAEKTAELRAVEEKLTADQQIIQASAEKVTALLQIDTIEVKRKALGDKVTLSAADYEKVADLAKKQIAAENDKTEMADAVERLTEENDELLQNVAKLRELNKTLVSEKTALQKAVDRLEKSLRSVQEEVSYWKWKFNKAMEFLDMHKLRERFLEFVGQHKHLRR
ncbi:MAG: plasmid recombination protein [Ruminococcus sp.]|nr:plasmid recombination protein [Ruminococcus sp.]